MVVKAFNTAAADKFGFNLRPGMGFDLVAEFDASDEKIDGDKATLIFRGRPNDPSPPTLEKDSHRLGPGPQQHVKGPFHLHDDVEMLTAMTKALPTLTEDVKNGKYKSADEAVSAFQQAHESFLSRIDSLPASK